jgi:coatomer subunit gamma
MLLPSHPDVAFCGRLATRSASELVCCMQVSATDYIKAIPVANFKAAWDSMGEGSEVSGAYGLDTTDGVAATVETMIKHMGMYVAEGTDLVAPNARSHMLMLSGEVCGGHRALLRISFGLDGSGAMAMKVVTRADSEEVSQILDEIVQNM